LGVSGHDAEEFAGEAVHDVVPAALTLLASVREILGVGALVSGDPGLVVLTFFELGDDSHVSALQSRYWPSLSTRAMDESLAQLEVSAVSFLEEVRDPGRGVGVLGSLSPTGAVVGAGP